MLPFTVVLNLLNAVTLYTVPHAVVTPKYEIILLQYHNCNLDCYEFNCKYGGYLICNSCERVHQPPHPPPSVIMTHRLGLGSPLL